MSRRPCHAPSRPIPWSCVATRPFGKHTAICRRHRAPPCPCICACSSEGGRSSCGLVWVSGTPFPPPPPKRGETVATPHRSPKEHGCFPPWRAVSTSLWCWRGRRGSAWAASYQVRPNPQATAQERVSRVCAFESLAHRARWMRPGVCVALLQRAWCLPCCAGWPTCGWAA